MHCIYQNLDNIYSQHQDETIKKSYKRHVPFLEL